MKEQTANNQANIFILPEPIQVTLQKWNDDTLPMVSVSCNTYNQDLYIRDAIEGFLKQKTNFRIEILIHDDASTDKTADIIREYEGKYPELIKPTYQIENQYSQKGGSKNRVPRRPPRGKYYALCEGDDYWTDPFKLQKQVDFMEKNPDYSLCFHNAMVIYEQDKRKPHIFTKLTKSEYSIDDVIIMDWFIPTQSIIFRTELYDSPKWSNYVFGADYAFLLRLASKGKFKAFDEPMSVYRKHAGGISANLPANYTSLKKIETLSFFNYHSQFQYNSIIQEKIRAINSSLYLNALSSRPLFSRIFSLDYILEKIRTRNFLNTNAL